MIGKTVSHYRIIEKLGEGGMGVVYKAEDTTLKRLVALKFLPLEYSRDEEAKGRFFHEARAAAGLEHPNIATVFEIAEAEGQIFIAMSCVEGRTLKDRIYKSEKHAAPLPLNEAIDTAIQIGEGLALAHENGIVHRDVKSSNIMITGKGQVKIMDFGLAKLKGQTKVTREGTTMGTVAYMSPEQALGKDVDQRTDIWSMGVVLYEMLCGQLPFKGEYDQSIMYAIMNEKQQPITGLRSGVPLELEKIIEKALEKNRDERYQHVIDMVVDLRRVKKESGPEISAAKEKTKPQVSFKFSRKFLYSGIIAALSLFGVAAYFLFFAGKGARAPLQFDRPALAVLYFSNKTGDPSLDAWRDGLAMMMTSKLSQSKYIRVLPDDQVYSLLKKLNLLDAKNYSTENLREIATRGLATHLLRGQLFKSGNSYRLQVTLQESSRLEDSAGNFQAQGVGDGSFFAMVDELADRIKGGMGISAKRLATDIDEEMGKVTTRSPEAFRYYSEAMKAGYRGDENKKAELLEKAVVIDPQFAMAYSGLAGAYSNILPARWVEVRKNLDKALSLVDRVSLRERYLIQGYAKKDVAKKYEVYVRLLELYPDDVIGNLQFGMFLANWCGNFEGATERLEVNIRNRVMNPTSYFNAIFYYSRLGMYDKAIDTARIYINEIQDQWTIHWQVALVYLCMGQYETALAEVQRALELQPPIQSLGVVDLNLTTGDIHFLRGDFQAAEREYRKLLQSPELNDQYKGRQRLSYLFQALGRYNKAIETRREEIESARRQGKSDMEMNAKNLLVEFYLSVNRIQEASALFKELEPLAEQTGDFGDLWLKNYHATLKCLICLGKGEYAEARKMAAVARKSREKIFDEQYKNLPESVFGKNGKKWLFPDQLWLEGRVELESGNTTEAVKKLKEAYSTLYFQSYIFYRSDFHARYLWPLATAYLAAGDSESAVRTFEEITKLTSGRLFDCTDSYARSFYMLGKIYAELGQKEKAIESYSKFADLWKDCDLQFRPMVEEAKEQVKKLSGK